VVSVPEITVGERFGPAPQNEGTERRRLAEGTRRASWGGRRRVAPVVSGGPLPGISSQFRRRSQQWRKPSLEKRSL